MSRTRLFPEVQERYAAYCVAHGCTPDQMLECDRERYPGGCMTGYILWVGEMIQRFWKSGGRTCNGNPWSQPEFSAFIWSQVERVKGEVTNV